VNINAGARTGMSSVITAAFVLLTLLFLTPLLYHLPQAVLAAVIIMAVIGLVNFGAVKHAWQANRHDGIAAVVTFVATLAFAPHLDNGIMVGAGLAIVPLPLSHHDPARGHPRPPSGRHPARCGGAQPAALAGGHRRAFRRPALLRQRGLLRGRHPRSGGRQSRRTLPAGGGRGHQRA
jgi:hypothetical protein